MRKLSSGFISAAATLFLIQTSFVISPAAAETVCVKYGQCPLDIASFACADTPRSSFVRRICYDAPKRFMVIKLKETWYPYCEVDAGSVETLKGAPSIGRYYNDHFRSRGAAHGPFDCRDHPMPKY